MPQAAGEQKKTTAAANAENSLNTAYFGSQCARRENDFESSLASLEPGKP